MDVDLHKPLLGDTIDERNTDTFDSKRPINEEKRQEYEDDDDDDVQAVWFLCSLKVMGSNEDSDDDDDDFNDLEKNLMVYDKNNDDGTDRTDDESSPTSTWYWNCFISSILPLLLYFQFYVTYHYNDDGSSEHYNSSSSSSMIKMTNDWSSIQWSIFLFVVTSILYRQSMAYQQGSSNSRDNKISYCDLILHLVPDIIIDVLLVLILFHYYIAAVLAMQLSTIFLAVNAILNSCNCSVRFGATTHERN